jgi:hypothetical protein
LKLPFENKKRAEILSHFPNHSDLLREYKTNCVDVESLMSYYLNQMKCIEKDSSQFSKNGISSPIITTVCLNNLTDAVCVMLEMEDEPVSIASMALYVLNNRKFEGANQLNSYKNAEQFDMIDAILESRGRDQLDFGTEIQEKYFRNQSSTKKKTGISGVVPKIVDKYINNVVGVVENVIAPRFRLRSFISNEKYIFLVKQVV